MVKEKREDTNIKSFYKDNQYFLFVTERFEDIRLVGAPPKSIGKFGTDTGNWVFPRHTGYFSLFRIYANIDNQPAKYSEDNVPYSPKHYLPKSHVEVSIYDKTAWSSLDSALILFEGSSENILKKINEDSTYV